MRRRKLLRREKQHGYGVHTRCGSAFLASTAAVWALHAPTPPTPDLTPHTADEVRVLHANIAGGVFAFPWETTQKPSNVSTTAVAERVFEVAQDAKPQIFSLNEVCESQAKWLARKLATAPHRMQVVFAPAQKQNPACMVTGDFAGGRQGVAVLSHVPVTEIERFAFTDDELHHDKNTARPGLCVTAALKRDTRVCSVHLDYYTDPENPQRSLGAAQAEALQRWLTPESKKQPVIVAGDFNAPPDQLSALYAHLDTVTNRTEGTLTRESGPKIDYIFSNTSFNTVEWGARDLGECRVKLFDVIPLQKRACSDHLMLDGRLRFTQ